MSRPAVAVIGAGWAGATTARLVHDAGYEACVFERDQVLGGHSRSARLNGILYEPNGPHVFHTSNAEVARFVEAHGMSGSYEHQVHTEIFLDDDDDEPTILSWPAQVAELRELRLWPQIERELAELPDSPSLENLETYCISIMGQTLYRLFVRDYSRKQWGREPSEMSSAFGPKRLGLRSDGRTRYFNEKWEYLPPNGAQEVIENILRPVGITIGENLDCDKLSELALQFQAVVITAALDEFVGASGDLEWRGIRTVSRYTPLDDCAATLTVGYQVNRPSMRRPYTRTIEAKHAGGQAVPGTVVTEEYAGADARHYPVPTVDGRNERFNLELQARIRDFSPVPVFFCGRLANYVYINQDEAIAQGMACAREVVELFRCSTGDQSSS